MRGLPAASAQKGKTKYHVQRNRKDQPLADRVPGDLYHRRGGVHPVHLQQLAGDRAGILRPQPGGHALYERHPGPHRPGPCVRAHHPQAGPFCRVLPGGPAAHALPAGLYPAVCAAHQLAAFGRPAHRRHRRDHPAVCGRALVPGHRRLDRFCRRGGRHAGVAGAFADRPRRHLLLFHQEGEPPPAQERDELRRRQARIRRQPAGHDAPDAAGAETDYELEEGEEYQ